VVLRRISHEDGSRRIPLDGPPADKPFEWHEMTNVAKTKAALELVDTIRTCEMWEELDILLRCSSLDPTGYGVNWLAETLLFKACKNQTNVHTRGKRRGTHSGFHTRSGWCHIHERSERQGRRAWKAPTRRARNGHVLDSTVLRDSPE
jgi:hypothetical protein